MVSSDTLRAIERLKEHIRSGCLSDIPPGGGTNRNERFHHHINSVCNSSKMGILLAYALLTVVMYSHNSSVTKHGQIVARPIAASPYFRLDMSGLKPIGIMPKEQDVCSSDCWEVDLSESTIVCSHIPDITAETSHYDDTWCNGTF